MTVGHMGDVTVQRFDNRAAQLAAAAFGALLVLLALGGLAASSGTAVIYVAFGVYTVVRGLCSSRVVVNGSAVTTRSMVRTRRYAFSDLREVEVAVGRTGVTGFGREHLVFHRADGQDVAFKELNCRPPEPPQRTAVVRQAAACINERLPRSGGPGRPDPAAGSTP